MGFLKDLTTLTRQANAAYDRMDVGASMAAASRSMEDASRVLAATTPQPEEAAFEAVRLHATANVVDARQLPMVIGMNVVVELDLVVAMPNGFPLPVTRTEQVAPLHLARVTPGSTVDVSMVPGRPDTVRIEWGA
ncbi:hypothetical protein ACWEOH_12430 [Agromyces sp. NPDC004153]